MSRPRAVVLGARPWRVLSWCVPVLIMASCASPATRAADHDLAGSAVDGSIMAFTSDETTNAVHLDFGQADQLPPDLRAALDGEFAGERVDIAGGWYLSDEQVQDVFDRFGVLTGIDVRYRTTRNLSSQIFEAAEVGNLPEIVHTMQIATMRQLADGGYVLPMSSDIVAMVDSQFAPFAYSYQNQGEPVYAVPWKVSAKSLVWYDPVRFAEAGYEVPTTMAELDDLTGQMLKDGASAPWCVGIGADGATGYIITDWLENYLLRMSGPEVYDSWVGHDIPFDAEPVVEALDAVGQTWFGDPLSVYGGRNGILGLSVQTAGDGLFDDPPACWMHTQALWAQKFWVDNGFDGASMDFFVLPGVEPGPAPIMVAGSFIGLTVDEPAARAVVEFLISVPGMESFVRNGGFVSPNATLPLEWYPPVERRVADLIASAPVLRFDATDSMPPRIGTDVAWKELVRWAEGEGVDTAEVLADIETSWADGG